MTRGRPRLLVASALLAVLAGVFCWWGCVAWRRIRFLHDLELVHFSTSLIGMPHVAKERAARQRAKELHIDLFAAYRRNLGKGRRCDLAWLLISDESPDYIEYAKTNIHSFLWPEVRIWVHRRVDETLSEDYRRNLLELILASPTSEAKLAAGRYHRARGQIAEAEDAYCAAMKNGLFWDALDAADALIDSDRYHADAVRHHLSVLRDAEYFTARAAGSLLRLYHVGEQLQPLVDACEREAKDGANRKALVGKLTKLVEEDLGRTGPKSHGP